MRDAMSLLDQVISFSGSTITAQSVRDSIGLIEGQTLLGIVRGIFDRKPLDALTLVEQAYGRGHDLRVLTRSLIEFLHGAVLARIGATHSATLELSEEEWKELKEISEKRSLEEIEMIFQVLHHGLEWIARSPQPKIVLDVLLVKCATAETLVYVDQPQGPAPTQGPGSGGAGPSMGARPSPLPTPVASAPVAGAQTVQIPKAVVVPEAVPAATPKSWEGFIGQVRKSRPLLASMLEHGHCEDPQMTDDALLICYPPSDAYYREQLGSRIYSEQLLTLAKEYFGRSLRIQIEIREGGESMAARRERELKERERTARSAAQNHPIILEAKALFGGELGPIELTDHAPEARMVR